MPEEVIFEAISGDFVEVGYVRGLLLPPIFFWNEMEEKHKGESRAFAGGQRG